MIWYVLQVPKAWLEKGAWKNNNQPNKYGESLLLK